MRAKDIAERTLALAKDATPGKWIAVKYMAHASPENMQTLAQAYLDLAAAVEAYREQRHGGKTTFTATAKEAAMYRAARGERRVKC